MKQFNKYIPLNDIDLPPIDDVQTTSPTKQLFMLQLNDHNHQDKQINGSKFQIHSLTLQILSITLMFMILIVTLIFLMDTSSQSHPHNYNFVFEEQIDYINPTPKQTVNFPLTTFNKNQIKSGLLSQKQLQTIITSLKQHKPPPTSNPSSNIIFANNTKPKVSVILINENKPEWLQKTIKSFKDMNTYPISQIMVIVNESKKQKTSNLIKKYPYIKWIFINFSMGQLQLLDQVLANISSNTQYYCYLKDNIQFNSKGFIQNTLNIFVRTINTSQVLFKNIQGINRDITLIDTQLSGFVLKPSVFTLKIYKLFGGYANLTKNVTYGKSAQLADIVISMYYLDQGYHIQTLPQNSIVQFSPSPSAWQKFVLNDSLQKKQAKQLTATQQDQLWLIAKTKQLAAIQYNYTKLLKSQLNTAFYLQSSPAINYNKFVISDLGLDINIEVGSKLDYLNISSTNKFLSLQSKFEKVYISYPFLGPKWKPTPLQLLPLKTLKTFQQTQQYLSQKISSNKSNFYYNLALKLASPQQIKQQSLQAQYIIYNKTHPQLITQKSLQLCLFIQGFNLATKSKYKQLLTSINNQNYSAFQLVIIDDASTDNSRAEIFNLIKKDYPQLYSKLFTVAKNSFRLYTAGNLQAKVKKYCGFSDVVVSIGPNSYLLGKQALNIINRIFQSQSTWVAIFPSIQFLKNKYTYTKVSNLTNIRTSTQKFDSSLKAYRYKLNYQLPIQSSIYLQRNTANGYLIPKYYQINRDIFQIYSYIELSGINRVYLGDQFLSFYEDFPNDFTCGNDHISYTLTKAQLKTQYKPLQNLQSKPQQLSSYQLPEKLLHQLKQQYTKYKQCLLKHSPSTFVSPSLSPQTIQYAKIGDLIKKSISSKSKPSNIVGVSSFIPIQQLPFCLFMKISNSLQLKLRNQIIQSIFNLNYSNYKLIFLTNSEIKTELAKFLTSLKKPPNSIYELMNIQKLTYEITNLLIKYLCPQNSLIMFVNYPLNPDSLVHLNKIHQTTKSWLILSQTQHISHLHSFYSRIYDLIKINDQSQNITQHHIDQGDQQVQFLAISELCLKHRTFTQTQNIYKIPQNSPKPYTSMLIGNKTDDKLYTHQSHTYLLSLRQYSSSNLSKVKILQKQYSQIYRGTSFNSLSQITYKHLIAALDYQDASYLPVSHNIHKRQRNQLSKLLDDNINMHSPDKQLPICFTLIIDDTMPQPQILNSIRSILRQNYTNYHLIILHDPSDQPQSQLQDKISKYTKQLKPSIQIKYIKNKNKKYPTYNILNTAFNYCNSDDIQIYIDGNFQLIGRQILTAFNLVYLNNENTNIVYSNYKSFQYQVANITTFINQNQYTSFNGRKQISNLPIFTSWKVKLIRMIPLKYHQVNKAKWYKTASLEALTYSLLELSTPINLQYLPYIAYQKYQSNTLQFPYQQKQQQMTSILQLPPLQVTSFNQQLINNEIQQILKNEQNVQFSTFDINL